MGTKLLEIFLLICLFNILNATLSPSDRTRTKPKVSKVMEGPIKASVFDRKLVEKEPLARDIITESGAYNKDTFTRLFNGSTLGYVTPWNNHGYDVAKLWAQKFDIISPVWLQIVPKGHGQYELRGSHDIDMGWSETVRKYSLGNTRLYPRVIFDKFNDADFSSLLANDEYQRSVESLLVKTCRNFRFDGIVLEVWSQLGGRVDDDILSNLIIGISKALKQYSYKLILVIPPYRKEAHSLFTQKNFEQLYKHVRAFSLMTYDYSSVQRPGANAPLYWMRKAVEKLVPNTMDDYMMKRKKILMGLNFYGNDYTPDGGGPIVGNQFLELVQNVKKRLAFDEKDIENYFEVKTETGRHTVFYPTLYSINERVKLATELGVGISIWELGQGLDYFYDLL